MLIPSLLWLVLGLLIGALANATKLRPASWDRGGRLGMLGGWARGCSTRSLPQPLPSGSLCWVLRSCLG